MNLFTQIKKIISIALLLCVFVGVVPMETFAQGTGPDMSAYPGWDKSKIVVSDNYTNLDKQPSSLSVVKPEDRGKTTNLRSDELRTLINKTGTEKFKSFTEGSSLSDKNFSGEDVNTDNYYKVNDSELGNLYYYKGANKADSSDDIFLGRASRGEFNIPLQKIPKASDQNNPTSTNIATERGFVNASDTQYGINPQGENNSYDRFAAVDQYEKNKKLLQTAESSGLTNEIEKILSSGKEKNGTALTPERKTLLENRLVQLKNEKETLRASVEKGKTEANKGDQISLDACPGGVLDVGKIINPTCVITLLAIVANIGLKLSAFVLYWTGNLFDYSIEIAVNSAEFLNRLGIIEPTWAFVRDALNMTFIFILLFVAVKILLGRSGYTAKGSIARLVLVAILMNFSLFAAKIMVDASNIISLNIYEGIKTKEGTSPDKRGNVSARIMTTLGLNGIYNFPAIFDNKTVQGCGTMPGTILTVGIFGSILMLITTLTFLLAAILFFLRMLNIIVLFITSPVWVWGYVMENSSTKKGSEWWQKNMWHVLKFPVMYMLFLYVTLAMFAQLNTIQTSPDGTRMSFIQLICDTTTNTASGSDAVFAKLPLILNFLIVIASLMGIIVYSTKRSGDAGVLGTGKMATNFSNKINTIQKRFTTGAAQGIYNKSRDLSVNTAKSVAKGTVTLAKDSVRFLGNKASNKAAGSFAKAASGEGAIGKMFANSPKAQTAFAVVSDKLQDRKFFNETEEQASKRRTTPRAKRAKTLRKVQATALKLEDETKWKKENPEGTNMEYTEYTKQKVASIEQAQLGGLQNTKIKKSDGTEVTTQEFIREGIYVKSKDKNGNEVEKVDQERLYKNIQAARKAHAETGDLLKAEKSKRFGWVMNANAKVDIKAQDEALSKTLSEIRSKKTGDIDKKIEGLREQLDRLPLDFENKTPAERKNLYDSIVSYYVDHDKIIKERDDQLSRAKQPVEIKKIKDEADAQLQKIKAVTLETVKDKRSSVEEAISKKEQEKEDKQEKADKKKESEKDKGDKNKSKDDKDKGDNNKGKDDKDKK